MENYPLIKKLGLEVINDPYPHIPCSKLNSALKKHKLSIEKFDEYFGVQTCLRLDSGESGLYPWDVEAVLVRMKTGKLSGSQLFWD